MNHDVAIIGAGIFGLWAARHAIKRGESVLVLEKRQIGSGASGGFLGALMPHMPDNWNAKKQMQFDALSSMADAVASLEADTGIDCGYRRCGRLMPLTHERMPDHATRRIEGANANWLGKIGNQAFTMELLGPDFKGTIGEGWLSEAAAPYGATFDTLSARINPRAYLSTLAAYVRNSVNGVILEGVEVVNVKDAGNGSTSVIIEARNGTSYLAGRVLVANGWEAYPLLERMGAQIDQIRVTGRGVKGQAVLLNHPHQDNKPILYDNGSYIVPHAANRVAIGSTSVDHWMPMGLGDNDEAWSTESFAGEMVPGDPMAEMLMEATIKSFDPHSMEFYNHALFLCPELTNAPLSERWANIRPRNTMRDAVTGKIGTEPVFGALDGKENIHVAIGGFKISLGIAHEMAK